MDALYIKYQNIQKFLTYQEYRNLVVKEKFLDKKDFIKTIQVDEYIQHKCQNSVLCTKAISLNYFINIAMAHFKIIIYLDF